MGKKDFDEYLRKRRQEPEQPDIDWTKERDEWLAYLDQLHEMIEHFLKEYIESGDISIEKVKKLINEEPIGEYEASSMTLEVRGNQVTLDPIGTNVIGAKGRVDMKGKCRNRQACPGGQRATRPLYKLTIRFPGAPETGKKR